MTPQEEFWRKQELDIQIIKIIIQEKNDGWEEELDNREVKFYNSIRERFDSRCI